MKKVPLQWNHEDGIITNVIRTQFTLTEFFAGLLILGIFLSGPIFSKPSEDFIPKFKPEVTVNATSQSIEIDGDLDDSGWQSAARVTGFSEFEPGDNVRPPVNTEVLLTYDEKNLYIAFKADGDPENIRASLQDRDQAFQDDFVGILLDTYGNASWAYELFANPYGIQMDGRWMSNGEDMSFDILFHTGGKITGNGYQVEFAIPFRSLRFPAGESGPWRITFFRNHPRDHRGQYSWAALDRDNPCVLCQLGYLKGIQGIPSGKNLEIMPSFIGFQSGEKADAEKRDSEFLTDPVIGDLSLGAKYGITPNLTVDFAYNPDFSQVEADAAQIDVNTTYALSFPERRPFFQEGSDLFDTFVNAVYTRSINDPILTAKLTGRIGNTSLAYIGARDEHSPVLVPFEEQSEFIGENRSIQSFSNIFRLKQNYQDDSYLGLLITDRRLENGGAGSVLSLDGSLRFRQIYQFQWQVLGSNTVEPNDTSLSGDLPDLRFGEENFTAAFDGESFPGHALYAEFNRSARHWSYELDYREYSPTFRAENGFVPQNNRRQVSFWTEYELRPQSDFVIDISPQISLGREWNFDQIRKDEWIRPGISGNIIGQTYISGGYIISRERFHDEYFPGIRRWQFNISSDFTDLLQPGLYCSWGKTIARNEDPPVLADKMELSLRADIKPSERLILQPDFDYFRLTGESGMSLEEGYIFRTKANYQISRSFYLRLVAQYNQFNDRFQIDPLLTYRINAFSVIYLGSTHDFREYSDPRAYRQTDRQIFLKARYLFQL